MTFLFWFSVTATVYAYFGYYVLLRALSAVRARPVRTAAFTPAVTVIVPVYNGAEKIERKLRNLCAQAYPGDRQEIVVVSDGSTDDTAARVRGYADPRVRLIELAARSGKEIAQRAAIDAAAGELCVFTDVDTQLSADGLSYIVEPFADPRVGAVTSRNVTTSNSSGEGHFIRYDMALREMESAIGSVVGLSGAFCAVRRELCDPWPTDVPSDFVVVLQLVRRGFRAVLEPRATATYGTTPSLGGEFQRKVRTVQRGIAALIRVPDVLLPWRTGFFSIQLISHKVLRWCVPFFMAAALLSSLALSGDVLYRALFAAQVVYYSAAVLALVWPRLQGVLLFRMVGFMVLTNLSILVAWLRYLRDGTVQVWQPTGR